MVFIYFTLLTLTQKEEKRRVAVKETTQILNTSRISLLTNWYNWEIQEMWKSLRMARKLCACFMCKVKFSGKRWGGRLPRHRSQTETASAKASWIVLDSLVFCAQMIICISDWQNRGSCQNSRTENAWTSYLWPWTLPRAHQWLCDFISSSVKLRQYFPTSRYSGSNNG